MSYNGRRSYSRQVNLYTAYAPAAVEITIVKVRTTITNRYSKGCYACGQEVLAQTGVCGTTGTEWLTFHNDCASPRGAVATTLSALKNKLADNAAGVIAPYADLAQAGINGDGVSALAFARLFQTITVVTPVVPTRPIGVKQTGRCIPNRFGKKCTVCKVYVETGEGFAAGDATGWYTYCATCANTDVVAENADKVELGHLVDDVLARVFPNDDRLAPRASVALPSFTGNNDLDFFVVRRLTNGERRIERTVGGHGDNPVTLTEALTVARALKLYDTPALVAAVLRYGAELGQCARCARSLTDEESRAHGLGPECRKSV
jgi:hypothetical protein